METLAVLPSRPDHTTDSCSSDLESESPDSEMRYLTLGDDTLVGFTITSIPDPVAVTFVHDIPRLNSMWDDTSCHWGGESVLTIQGHAIPIVYWPEVYHYGKVRQWQGTKSRWTDWRVCFSL